MAKGKVIKVDSYKRSNPKKPGNHKVRSHFRRPPGSADKFPKQWEKNGFLLEDLSFDDLEFANERGKDGLHIGGEDQYQHSRFRCPECHRGMGYSDREDEWFCRVHGAESDISHHRDDNRGVYDTNQINDLKEFLDNIRGYDEIIKEYDPGEEELKQFGGKIMEESWHDYFSQKLDILKEVEGVD